MYFIWLRFLRNRSSDLVGAVSGFQGIGGHGDRIRDIAGGPVGQGGIAVPVGAAQFGIDPGEDAAGGVDCGIASVRSGGDGIEEAVDDHHDIAMTIGTGERSFSFERRVGTVDIGRPGLDCPVNGSRGNVPRGSGEEDPSKVSLIAWSMVISCSAVQAVFNPSGSLN